MVSENGILKLVSKEGNCYEVPVSIAKMSELVKNMISEEMDEGDQADVTEIPLPNVSSEILSKVIDFCTHYKTEPMNDIEKPLKSSNMAEIVQKWYADFINVDQSVLFEMVLAANYMNIQPLLDLSCATIAGLIKGKTPDEIRKVFNIVKDFTPEEEAQVREENKWCEEA